MTTARVLPPLLVYGFDHPEETARSVLNTPSELPSCRSRPEIEGNDDYTEGIMLAEFQTSRNIIKRVLNAKPATKSRKKPRVEKRSSFSEKYTQIPSVLEILKDIINEQSCYASESLACTDEMAENIATIVQHYYTLFKRNPPDSGRLKLPKHRIFVIAMLYVLREGVKVGNVELVQKNRVVCAFLPDVAELPAAVMTDKPRSVTTGIKFVKLALDSLVNRYGGAFRALQQIDCVM